MYSGMLTNSARLCLTVYEKAVGVGFAPADSTAYEKLNRCPKSSCFPYCGDVGSESAARAHVLNRGGRVQKHKGVTDELCVCKDVVERTDVPHVIRKCSHCGRDMHIVQPGEHGRGFVIRDGDRVVIPDGWLKLSLNPLQSTGRLFRPGLDMMARSLFLEGMYTKEETFAEAAAELERQTDEIVNGFEPLAGLDINNPADTAKIYSIMQGHSENREFWAFWTGQFLAISRDARERGDVNRAMWATACAERSRAMMMFKTALEEVVWMGHSAKRIIDILGVWEAHKENNDEQFWQVTFNDNTYVLSQVFAVPLVFIQDRAYVGGMKLDRSESRFIDYVFSAEASREAILIEIKTPTSPLLGREYRGNLPPSHELAGSVVQVLNYRYELGQNLRRLTQGTDVQLSAFNPKCAVIIGDAEAELRDETARRSFELFRAGLKDVEIVTYDELFRKVEILAELFRLKRTKPRNNT
jgi:hypothetical protein